MAKHKNQLRIQVNMKLFNTLTRKKEEFKEITKGEVSIYTCGPNKILF